MATRDAEMASAQKLADLSGLTPAASLKALRVLWSLEDTGQSLARLGRVLDLYSSYPGGAAALASTTGRPEADCKAALAMLRQLDQQRFDLRTLADRIGNGDRAQKRSVTAKPPRRVGPFDVQLRATTRHRPDRGLGDPCDWLDEWRLKLVVLPEDDGDWLDDEELEEGLGDKRPETIATATIFGVDPDNEGRESLWEMFDSHSGDLEWFSDIYRDGYLDSDLERVVEQPYGYFAIFNRLLVEPAWRGLGVGAYMFTSGTEMLGGKANFILLHPFAFEIEDEKHHRQDTERLTKYYRQLGAVDVPSHDGMMVVDPCVVPPVTAHEAAKAMCENLDR